MSVNLTINGVAYPFPVQGDSPPWGAEVTAWAQAVTGGMLQKAGGTFTLTADVDFGGTYGLKASKFSTRAANPSSSGLLRLENNATGIGWRNFLNNGDLLLTVNASDQLTFNGLPIGGAAAYTANRAIASDGSGNLVASSVTDTELGYLSGVTSAIQTQLNGKQASGTYVTSVGGTAPVVSSGGTTPAISMHVADASHDGYLSQTDWSTFNNKQPAGSYLTAVTADSPLSGSGTSGSHLTIPVATSLANGYLSSADWSTFNGKQAAGNYTKNISQSASDVTVANTAVETTVMQFTVPGGTLSTAKRIFGKVLVINYASGGNALDTCTFKLYYDSTVMSTVVETKKSASGGLQLIFDVCGNGATNAQVSALQLSDSFQSDNYTSIGTAAVDSTASKDIKITATWGRADPSDTLTATYYSAVVDY